MSHGGRKPLELETSFPGESAHLPRPIAVESFHLSEAPVLDELELVAWHETDAALWSRRVLQNERTKRAEADPGQ